MACPGPFVRDALQRRWRFDLALLRRLKRDDNLFERVHVDGVVIRWAPELPLLGRRGVAERDAEAAADAEVGANGTDHPPILVGDFDDTAGHRAGSLANRAGKCAKTMIRVDHGNRPWRLFPRPGHHLGPHGSDYTAFGHNGGGWTPTRTPAHSSSSSSRRPLSSAVTCSTRESSNGTRRDSTGWSRNWPPSPTGWRRPTPSWRKPCAPHGRCPAGRLRSGIRSTRK